MGTGTDVFFERVLLPHRSLPPGGFNILMLVLGLISLGVGIGFVSIGAWPVCGFFGLDIVLICAFRLNYRSARQREILRLAGEDFTVERIDVYGERLIWRFQPFWLRVILLERPDESNRLLLASHGRSLPIADFPVPRCAGNWPTRCARCCRAGAPPSTRRTTKDRILARTAPCGPPQAGERNSAREWRCEDQERMEVDHGARERDQGDAEQPHGGGRREPSERPEPRHSLR